MAGCLCCSERTGDLTPPSRNFVMDTMIHHCGSVPKSRDASVVKACTEVAKGCMHHSAHANNKHQAIPLEQGEHVHPQGSQVNAIHLQSIHTNFLTMEIPSSKAFLRAESHPDRGTLFIYQNCLDQNNQICQRTTTQMSIGKCAASPLLSGKTENELRSEVLKLLLPRAKVSFMSLPTEIHLKIIALVLNPIDLVCLSLVK